MLPITPGTTIRFFLPVPRSAALASCLSSTNASVPSHDATSRATSSSASIRSCSSQSALRNVSSLLMSAPEARELSHFLVRAERQSVFVDKTVQQASGIAVLRPQEPTRLRERLSGRHGVRIDKAQKEPKEQPREPARQHGGHSGLRSEKRADLPGEEPTFQLAR